MPIRPSERAKYPKDWKAISRRIRVDRAGNRCEWCGAANYMDHPETGAKVVLTVAHLDHDPTNCDPANLAALCQRCHNGYDAPHRRAGIVTRKRETQEACGQTTLKEAKR